MFFIAENFLATHIYHILKFTAVGWWCRAFCDECVPSYFITAVRLKLFTAWQVEECVWRVWGTSERFTASVLFLMVGLCRKKTSLLHICISYSLLCAVAGLSQTLVIHKLQALSLFTSLFVFCNRVSCCSLLPQRKQCCSFICCTDIPNSSYSGYLRLILVDFLSVVTIFTTFYVAPGCWSHFPVWPNVRDSPLSSPMWMVSIKDGLLGLHAVSSWFLFLNLTP